MKDEADRWIDECHFNESLNRDWVQQEINDKRGYKYTRTQPKRFDEIFEIIMSNLKKEGINK